MFTRQRTDCKKPFFGLFQLHRIERHRLDRIGHPGQSLIQFHHGPVQGGHRRFERALRPLRRPVKPAQRISQLAFGAALPHDFIGIDHIGPDFHGALHQPSFGIQRCFFAFLRVQLVQLCNCVPQEILLGFDRLPLDTRNLCGLAGRAQPGPTATNLRDGPGVAGKFIQNRTMTARVQQPPVVMLTM